MNLIRGFDPSSIAQFMVAGCAFAICSFLLPGKLASTAKRVSDCVLVVLGAVCLASSFIEREFIAGLHRTTALLCGVVVAVSTLTHHIVRNTPSSSSNPPQQIPCVSFTPVLLPELVSTPPSLPRGIPNTGASCYRTASLQLLFTSSRLMEMIGQRDIQSLSQNQKTVIEAFRAHFQDYTSRSNDQTALKSSDQKFIETLWPILYPHAEETARTQMDAAEFFKKLTRHLVPDDTIAYHSCFLNAQEKLTEIDPEGASYAAIEIHRPMSSVTYSIPHPNGEVETFFSVQKGASTLELASTKVAFRRGQSYELTGAVIHKGSQHNGHYTALVKVNGTWCACDDASITVILDEQSVLQEINANASLLLLSRTNSQHPV